MQITQDIPLFSVHALHQPILFDVSSPKKQNTLITLDAFYLHEAKQDGVSQGGVYKDATGATWMVKEPQWGELANGVREFVAGALFQNLLGDYAPKTSLIYDVDNHEVMVGSKFLHDFQTISDIAWNDYSTNSDSDFAWYDISYDVFMPMAVNYAEYGKNAGSEGITPAEINGKSIGNYTNVLASVIFLNDGDAHQGNMGLVEEQDVYMFAKIDHGFALDEDYWGGHKVTLQNFAWETARYDFYDLDRLGYDNMYQSIKMVVDMPFDEIESLVSDKIEEARPYIDQWQQDHALDTPSDDYSAWALMDNQKFNIDDLKAEILDMLETRQQSFKEILQDMELDHAIFTNDIEAVQNLFSVGIDFSRPIFPFHNTDSSILDFEAKNPLTLANHYESAEVSNFIKDNISPGLNLSRNDVFLDDSDGGFIFNPPEFVFDFQQNFLPLFVFEPSILIPEF